MNTTNRPDERARERPSDASALFERIPPAERAPLRAIWDLAARTDPYPEPDSSEADRALQTLLARVDAANGAASATSRRGVDRPLRRPSHSKDRRPLVWTGAASVLAVAALALFIWTRPVVHLIGAGERLELTLPDGSRVELNSGSRIAYARGFGERRQVHLTGEAFFTVVGSTAAFEVTTHNASVRVLGTRFGVRAWRDGLGDGTTVAVESGRVVLSAGARNGRAVELAAGQTGRVRDAGDGMGTVERAAVSVEDATAWRRGDLIYKDQFLGVVVEDVRRRFAAEIELRPSRLRETRISLALRRPETAEVVVRDLASALGLAYRPIAGGFELYVHADRQRNEAGAN